MNNELLMAGTYGMWLVFRLEYIIAIYNDIFFTLHSKNLLITIQNTVKNVKNLIH